MPMDQKILASLRPGDVVTVAATVKYSPSIDKESLFVSFGDDGYGQQGSVEFREVHALSSRKFKTGEVAFHDGEEVEVIAVDGPDAWVKAKNGARRTLDVADLFPVPAPLPLDGGAA